MDFTTNNNPRLLDAFIDTWLHSAHMKKEDIDQGSLLPSPVRSFLQRISDTTSSAASFSNTSPLAADQLATASGGSHGGKLTEAIQTEESSCINEGGLEAPLLQTPDQHSPDQCCSVNQSTEPASLCCIRITEDIFVSVLESWFMEKQLCFKRDFPHEKTPKKVVLAGKNAAAHWLLTKGAPEEYRDKLMSLSSGNTPSPPR
jgi:hypothetical protein